ncbi:MAG TPA: RluA family pseudouridine synthase [Candidatus Marinimicrobia bacterium]|nr:RluA family pseudouridine synthase [Candidatus Neomarinimicrobiota bacterium]
MNHQKQTSEQRFQVQAGQTLRLDVFLAERVNGLSRSRIHDLIRTGEVTVNAAPSKPGYRLKKSDLVAIKIPEPEPAEIIPEELDLEIIYEDDYYLAINKPPGLVVHPGAGNFQGTLVSGLLNYTENLSAVAGRMRPGLVHRLDKDTSGALIIARSDEAHRKLGKLFADRQVYKEYRALVWGVPFPEKGAVEAALERDPRNRKKFRIGAQGKYARSCYELIKAYEIGSYLKVIIETGRTHQIRVHLHHIGHPVIGDKTYGGGKRWFGNLDKAEQDLARQLVARCGRQMLHAYRIRFEHPFLQRDLDITAPLPEDFRSNLELLDSYREKDG